MTDWIFKLIVLLCVVTIILLIANYMKKGRNLIYLVLCVCIVINVLLTMKLRQLSAPVADSFISEYDTPAQTTDTTGDVDVVDTQSAEE